MPSVTIYVTDIQYGALARLAKPGQGVKDVLVRFAEMAVTEQGIKRRPKRRPIEVLS